MVKLSFVLIYVFLCLMDKEEDHKKSKKILGDVISTLHMTLCHEPQQNPFDIFMQM